MAFLSFNAKAVEPQAPIEVLPAGNYIAAVQESDIAHTKSGTGQMLKLVWKVLEGQHAGRLIFDRINISNQNPKAEEIGQRQLSALCHAVNVLNLSDTTQLHGIPAILRVAVRKDESGQYGDQNEVKSYSAAQGHAAPAMAAQTQAPAARPASGPTPPWAGNRAA